jgi:UDP-glucose 4-epimerase
VADNLSTGLEENLNPRAKFHKLDLGDFGEVKKLFDRYNFEAVFHLAAQIDVRKSVAEPVADAKINILNAIQLIDLATKYKVNKFVFSSTGGAIYGDGVYIPTPEQAHAQPLSPYGCAKLSIEYYLQYYNLVHGLNYTILRYANVYGPRQNPKGEAGVVSIFLDAMLQKRQPVIFGGVQTRDFVYVADVVAANLLALNDTKCEIYNVGYGVEKDIITVFSILNGFFENSFTPEYREKKKGEQLKSCLDYSRIKKELGWVPMNSLEEGLGKTYLWFRENVKK